MILPVEKQVCDLVYAKKLKKLVKQESLWWWQYNTTRQMWQVLPRYIQTDGISAFTVAELGEMLPNAFYSIFLDIFKCWICFESKDDGEIWTDHDLRADTEANARAKMLIWLIENKKIN